MTERTFMEQMLALAKKMKRYRQARKVLSFVAMAALAVAAALSRSESGHENLGLAIAVAGVSGLGALAAWIFERRVGVGFKLLRQGDGEEQGEGEEKGMQEKAAGPKEGERPSLGIDREHSDPEPVGPVLERFIPMDVEVEGVPAFRSSSADGEAGPALELPPGKAKVAFRFHGVKELEGEHIFYPIVETRVADRHGRWWSARTFLEPEAFCQPMDAEAAGDEEEEARLFLWDDAPEAWRRAILEGCDITGAFGLLDSRERFKFRVGDEFPVIMMKYQGPNVDASWVEGTGLMVVRVKQMVFERWHLDPWQAGPGEEAKFDDIIDNVTLCYRIPLSDICLFTRPTVHWSEWQQWYETEDLDEQIPLFEASEPPL